MKLNDSRRDNHSSSRVSMNVEIEPEVLESHFIDMQFPTALQKQLDRGSDWKVSFYPTVTPAMRSLFGQSRYCLAD